ncbi:MAG: hypothetical protein AAFU77_01550 [Myxococcota bacterium]
MKPHYRERAELFGRERTLVGVTCRATRPRADAPAVVFLNAGIISRVGANRLHVRLARALASVGVHSLRFDMAGIGDSVILPTSTSMTPERRVEIDIDDAVAFAQDRLGIRRVVLAGLCSGADNALRSMDRHPSVVGAILLDLNTHQTRGFYLRHYGRRLLRRETWRNVLSGRHPLLRKLLARARWVPVSTEAPAPSSMDTLLPNTRLSLDHMRRTLEALVRRDAKLLAVFTAGFETQYNYGEQFREMLPGLDFRNSLQLEYFADSDHTFSRSDLQSRLTGTVVRWIENTQFPSPTETPSTKRAG